MRKMIDFTLVGDEIHYFYRDFVTGEILKGEPTEKEIKDFIEMMEKDVDK